MGRNVLKLVSLSEINSDRGFVECFSLTKCLVLLGVNKILYYIKFPNYNFRMKAWWLYYQNKLGDFQHEK